MRAALPGLVVLAAWMAGCTSPRGLEGEPMALSAAERGAVEAQVQKARAEGEWTLAWNQSVDMGASREALEDVALGALAADERAAADMFEALFAKWGGLTPPARQRVDDLVRRAVEAGDPVRAAAIEIAAAEDAPAYQGAWRVYGAAPATSAPDVLERIRDARKKHAGRGR
jgi:hypothetical protein